MTSKKKTGKKKRKNMSRETRSSLLKYAGIAVGVLAVFTLVSTVSYLFTWTVDHSIKLKLLIQHYLDSNYSQVLMLQN